MAGCDCLFRIREQRPTDIAGPRKASLLEDWARVLGRGGLHDEATACSGRTRSRASPALAKAGPPKELSSLAAQTTEPRGGRRLELKSCRRSPDLREIRILDDPELESLGHCKRPARSDFGHRRDARRRRNKRRPCGSRTPCANARETRFYKAFHDNPRRPGSRSCDLRTEGATNESGHSSLRSRPPSRPWNRV